MILREMLAEKLKGIASVGTGFIIDDNGIVSTQVDIIVYKDGITPCFRKAEFVVVPKEAVLGIIEVKTKLTASNVIDTFRKADNNGRLIGRPIFNGVFSYEKGFNLEKVLSKKFEAACKKYYGYISDISLGADYFVKYWPSGMPNGSPGNKFHIYRFEQLSFGYFISNLIEDVHLALNDEAISIGMNKYMYPIVTSKENYVKHRIQIGD